MKRRKIAHLVLCLFFMIGIIGVLPGQAQDGGIAIGQTVVVTTDGQNLNLRSGAGTSNSIVARLANGTRMQVVGGPTTADGFTWWELESQGARGWAAGPFLRVATNAQTNSQDAPPFIWPLAAPWPATITLHSGGDGYGYGPGPTHRGPDLYAMDFNGRLNPDNPPEETNDEDLLVLSVADGCLKYVGNDPGETCVVNNEQAWCGNYGWNVVISHAAGYEVRYAHLKAEPLIRNMSTGGVPGCNQFITQGQPLGQIGGTGTQNDSAVHLHLAIYHCDPSNPRCQIEPVKPEPLDGVTALGNSTRVTSRNFSVGYAAIQGDALTHPDELLHLYHPPIVREYKYLGGQVQLFGRAATPVLPFPGTPLYYQLFAPHALMSIFSTALMEYNNQAYMFPMPIHDAYIRAYPRYGLPQTSTYVNSMGDGQSGWRADFTQASLLWHWNLDSPIVWDANNASWTAIFCPGTQQFNCNGVTRRDPYIDFSFSNSNDPGPLRNVQGFSGRWQASFEGSLVSRVTLRYRVQGHARFYIDNRPQGDWIHSPDDEAVGSTRPTWHVGGNTFRIEFWQEPGKPAQLSLERESGIIPSVHAFESLGAMESSAYQPPPPQEFADFEPPPYPDESASEDQFALPDIFPADFFTGLQQRLAEWWQGVVNSLRQSIEDWWQQQLERLQERLEEALVRALDEMLQQFLQQCCSAPVIPAAVLLGAAFAKRRHRLSRKR